MKRCPECGREYDNSMMFCLDDGAALLYGPASESSTVILHSTADPAEAPTRTQIETTERTAEPTLPDAVGSRKNSMIAGMVGILLVSALGIGGYWFYGRGGARQIESIAVMPFVNESGNSEIEYLSDGITETLIGSLSQLPNLGVKSRSMVFHYKGQTADLQKLGRDLDVQAILTGRVIQRGEQLTLSLELADAQTGNAIWNRQYDRKLTDIVALQKEIARDVSDKLRVKLSPPDEQKLTKSYTENPEAYHLYLKGAFYWNKQTESSSKEAITYFNQAIEKDPNYALAYAGLANANVALGIDYVRPKEAFPIAKLYAQKALDLAPELAEAHAAMGSISFFYDWDWAAADRELKHVIELDPESAEPYACTLHYLDSAGRPDDAVAEIRRIAAQHPTSITLNAEIGCSSYYAHRYDEAIADLQNTIEMDPGFWNAYYNLGRSYGQKKMYKEALASLTTANTLSNGTLFVIAELGYANAASGNKAAAMEALHRLEDAEASRYVDSYLKAIIYSGLGDKEKALSELEKAFQNRSTWLIWARVEPKFDILHNDRRFQDILQRMNLPAV